MQPSERPPVSRVREIRTHGGPPPRTTVPRPSSQVGVPTMATAVSERSSWRSRRCLACGPNPCPRTSSRSPWLTTTLPPTANAALQLRTLDERHGLSIRPLDLAAAPAVRTKRGRVFSAAFGMDLLYVRTSDRVEELRVLYGPHAPHTARYRLAFDGETASLRIRGQRVELVDETGKVRIDSAPIFAVDAKGTRIEPLLRLQVEGNGALLEIEIPRDPNRVYPITVDPSWGPGGSMTDSAQFVAVRLTSGKVLAAGASVAELFDPATNDGVLRGPFRVQPPFISAPCCCPAAKCWRWVATLRPPACTIRRRTPGAHSRLCHPHGGHPSWSCWPVVACWWPGARTPPSLRTHGSSILSPTRGPRLERSRSGATVHNPVRSPMDGSWWRAGLLLTSPTSTPPRSTTRRRRRSALLLFQKRRRISSTATRTASGLLPGRS